MRGSVRSACGCTRPRWAKTRRRSSPWRSRGRSSAASSSNGQSTVSNRCRSFSRRQCDSLGSVLERADRGAVAVTTRLRLVTRTEHVRTLHLPSPIRDPRTLRTLVLLDLESHPPPAAIDVVTLELDVAPGLIVQGTLLTRARPSPDDLATLTSRLCALMGDTRVGAPALVDTHDERQSTMAAFLAGGGRPKANGRRPKPADGATQAQGTAFVPCLRRYRLPLAVTVEVERGRPATVRSTARGIPGGDVVNVAGPWRTSGWLVGAGDRAGHGIATSGTSSSCRAGVTGS